MSTSCNKRGATALIAAALTINLAGGTAAVAAHGFSDVPSGAYYHDAVNWLAQTGITGGCGNGKFCPDDPTTRGQMAVFLKKAADSKGVPGGAFSDIPTSANGPAAVSAPLYGAPGFTAAATAEVTVTPGGQQLFSLAGQVILRSEAKAFSPDEPSNCPIGGMFEQSRPVLRLDGERVIELAMGTHGGEGFGSGAVTHSNGTYNWYESRTPLMTTFAFDPGTHRVEYGRMHGTCDAEGDYTAKGSVELREARFALTTAGRY